VAVYSDAYLEMLERGPFPGRIDPWAEAGQYFQQIHSGMIEAFIQQLQPQLLRLGYLIGKEASLQITTHVEPDIFIQRALDAPRPAAKWDYALAAEETLAEPGVMITAEIDLNALHIRELDTGRLVTIVELISPSNKTKPDQIAAYRDRRERLLIDHGIQIVEMDFTRSVKRLINTPYGQSVPYHVAVFLLREGARLIGIDYDAPLKRIALPLRAEVVPVEPQVAYTQAYRSVTIAAQMLNDDGYGEDDLPFPSLLTDAQKAEAIAAVAAWKSELTRLRV
jgi:hypothetical protein